MNRCPSHEELQQMLAGQLTGALEDALCDHVEQCPVCQHAMEELSAQHPRDFSSAIRIDRLADEQEFLNHLKSHPPAITLGSGYRSRANSNRQTADGRTERDGLPRPTFPGYEIIDELGRGGMGVVYKARHVALNRMVAIKTILAGSHATAHDRTRFQIEAEAAAGLQHPNLVRVYEVGAHDGYPYFSMEFIAGGTLRDHLRGVAQPPREAALLVETLARALHFAHERGIVHRDIKPANILLKGTQGARSRDDSTLPETNVATRRSGLASLEPLITDFGLAKVLSGEMRQTHTGAVIGTPEYMAPEQAGSTSQPIGPACDIHALGVILYELLTGRVPFTGATPAETLLKVVNAEPAPIGRLEPRVPHDLRIITHKCLEKDPKRRFSSASELADDLRRFLDDRPIQAQAPSFLYRISHVLRRHRGLVGGTVAVIIALIAGIAASLRFAAHVPAVEPSDVQPLSNALVVTNLKNSGAGSLRQAVMDANLKPGSDIIEFQQGLTGTVQLTSGAMQIRDALTITGHGIDQITINGNKTGRLLEIVDHAKVVVEGLTLTDGDTVGGGMGGAFMVKSGATLNLNRCAVRKNSSDYGGGAWVQTGGTLHISNCTFSENQSVKPDGGGGGLFIQGTVTITDSNFSNNKSAFNGGGIAVFIGGVLAVANSTISGNAAHHGGGILVYGGTVSATSSTLSSNTAHSGGGILNFNSPVFLTNCTIANNVAAHSGGGLSAENPAAGVQNSLPEFFAEFAESLVSSKGSTAISNCTFSANSARFGGGIDNVFGRQPVTLVNTIVAGNTASEAGSDFLNSVNSLGHNILGNTSDSSGFGVAGDLLNVDPKLSPLADNGGPTQTMAPQADSPAIDAGTNALGANPDGAVPDPTKWTIRTNIPQGDASVSIHDGKVQLVNRGYLNTRHQFDPADGGLHITGTWQFDGTNSDFLQILTRSDGTPADDFGETAHGVEFGVHVRNMTMHIIGRGAAEVSEGANAPVSIPPDAAFHFDIVDDGFNLTFTLTEVENPSKTATLTATSSSRLPRNFVTFHNREQDYLSGHTALLHSVLIRNVTTQSVLLEDDFSVLPVPLNDQRGPGFPRNVNQKADIGAIELQAAHIKNDEI